MLWQKSIIPSVERNILIIFLILPRSNTCHQLLPVEMFLCVSLQTCWQVGSWPSLARISSHSGESLVQAKLSRTFFSTWARCLTTAQGRPTSARNTSSITCQTTGKKREEDGGFLKVRKGVTLGSNPRPLGFEFGCQMLVSHKPPSFYETGMQTYFLLWSLSHKIIITSVCLNPVYSLCWLSQKTSDSIEKEQESCWLTY